MMEERRTIKIKESTYKGIKKLGIFGETFDDVLQRMLRVEKGKIGKPCKYEEKV